MIKFTKAYILVLQSSLVLSSSMDLYPETDIAKIKFKGDSSGDKSVLPCSTIRIPVSYTKSQKKSQLVDFRMDFHSGDALIGLRDKEKKIQFGISGCSDYNTCALDSLETAMPYKLPMNSGGLQCVEGQTVFPLTPSGYDSKCKRTDVKFITDNSSWKYGQKSNLGLGPQSSYFNFISQNYKERGADHDITMQFNVDINESEIDTINKGNPPSEDVKFQLYAGSNPAYNTVQYGGSFGAPQYPQLKTYTSWKVNSYIAFRNGLDSYVPDIGTQGCLDPTINNFLTVRTQDQYDSIWKQLNIETCGEVDCGSKLTSSSAPQLYLSFSIPNFSLTKYVNKLSSAVYTRKGGETYQIAVDVNKEIPQECDFVFGASFFAAQDVYFIVNANPPAGYYGAYLQITPKFHVTDWFNVIIVCIILITLIACCLQCCWSCLCKPQRNGNRNRNANQRRQQAQGVAPI